MTEKNNSILGNFCKTIVFYTEEEIFLLDTCCSTLWEILWMPPGWVYPNSPLEFGWHRYVAWLQTFSVEGRCGLGINFVCHLKFSPDSSNPSPVKFIPDFYGEGMRVKQLNSNFTKIFEDFGAFAVQATCPWYLWKIINHMGIGAIFPLCHRTMTFLGLWCISNGT